jgi:dsDNA-specific endonuclease/ATPase MutS2
VQIDKEELPALNAEKMVEALVEKPDTLEKKMPAPPKPAPREVDLHIEKLVTNPGQLKPQEMLQIQLHHFNRSMDAAFQCGHPDITLIHGVGNGTLKLEIHKLLAKNELVAFYQDAAKEKFGYGATKVYFK